MTKPDPLTKKKLQALKTVNKHLRNAVKSVLDRSERTLASFPDSKVAFLNKTDCEEALRTMKDIYDKIRLETNDTLPKNQLQIEVYRPLDEL